MQRRKGNWKKVVNGFRRPITEKAEGAKRTLKTLKLWRDDARKEKHGAHECKSLQEERKRREKKECPMKAFYRESDIKQYVGGGELEEG